MKKSQLLLSGALALALGVSLVLAVPGYGSITFLLPYHSVAQAVYPTLSGATVTLTASGSATFTLPGGLTFDDLNLGTRQSSYDYVDDVFQTVEAGAPIPEPSRLGLLALGAAGVLARRRRG